ncbi:MAG: hypothetical protein NVS3B21_01570 [Acidimicrobiales bacterium]
MSLSGHVCVAVVTAAVLAGCGGGAPSAKFRGTAGDKIQSAAAVAVPQEVLGLTVRAEDVTKTVANTKRAYIDSLALYGMRADNLLQATLQVSRFNADAKYQTDRFRLAVVNQVGTRRPTALTVQDQPVYLTAGNRQRIYVWFKGRYLFVLASRDDFASPRALLRSLLEIKP